MDGTGIDVVTREAKGIWIFYCKKVWAKRRAELCNRNTCCRNHVEYSSWYIWSQYALDQNPVSMRDCPKPIFYLRILFKKIPFQRSSTRTGSIFCIKIQIKTWLCTDEVIVTETKFRIHCIYNWHNCSLTKTTSIFSSYDIDFDINEFFHSYINF